MSHVGINSPGENLVLEKQPLEYLTPSAALMHPRRTAGGADGKGEVWCTQCRRGRRESHGFRRMGEGHTWQAGNNMAASGSLEVEVECNTDESAGV